jgi:hypothetical protein
MALSTSRDPTVILTDYTNYTAWLKQLKTRCQFLKVWKFIDPASTDEPKHETPIPMPPLIGQYQPSAAYTAANPNTPPTMPSHLSTAGAKSYKDDSDYHKGQLEMFKIVDRVYREEQANLDKVVTFLQSTISAHLQSNCCIPGQSIKEWVNNLAITVGVDLKDEYKRSRTRYQDALRPMRTAGLWVAWLAEYDHAATEAETNGVSELKMLDSVKDDFINAVLNVAPMWVSTFQLTGNKDPGIRRKDMMKLFREYMTLQHPIKGKQKGAFAAAGSYLAEGGESTQTTDRDASPVNEAASSRTRGRPRKQLANAGQKAKSKRSPITEDNESAAADGTRCPACDMRHNLRDCFYAFPEKQPEWFRPKQSLVTLVMLRKEHDPKLQEQLRSLKRARSQVPSIKLSHTPTPPRLMETDEK